MVTLPLPQDFDPDIYLSLHEDLQAAGVDPTTHFLEHGIKEKRVYRKIAGEVSPMDDYLHMNPMTKRPKYARHETIWEWLRAYANNEGVKVLELGSRSVVSDSLWKKVIPKCEYVGIDVMDGKNVDVVGDIHSLSQYFEEHTFDFVISFAVFEHLAMPWIVAEEISRVLKPGGYTIHETHFSFSEHEQPAHYFQFNSNALEVLFCEELGFKLIDSGLDTPIVGRYSYSAADYLRGKIVPNLFCHSSIISQKKPNHDCLHEYPYDWRTLLPRLVAQNHYPSESDWLHRHS